MAKQPSRGQRRPGPRLRHHLEDQFDRELDRLLGSGRARKRDTKRREEQYETLAHRLIEQTLLCELDELELGDAVLLRVELHGGGGLLTAHVGLQHEPHAALLERKSAIEAALRADLALELPRRHTPVVRLRFSSLPDDSIPDGDQRVEGGGA